MIVGTSSRTLPGKGMRRAIFFGLAALMLLALLLATPVLKVSAVNPPAVQTYYVPGVEANILADLDLMQNQTSPVGYDSSDGAGTHPDEWVIEDLSVGVGANPLSF